MKQVVQQATTLVRLKTVGDDIVLYIDLRYPVTFNLEDIVNAINSHLSENWFQ